MRPILSTICLRSFFNRKIIVEAAGQVCRVSYVSPGTLLYWVHSHRIPPSGQNCCWFEQGSFSEPPPLIDKINESHLQIFSEDDIIDQNERKLFYFQVFMIRNCSSSAGSTVLLWHWSVYCWGQVFATQQRGGWEVFWLLTATTSHSIASQEPLSRIYQQSRLAVILFCVVYCPAKAEAINVSEHFSVRPTQPKLRVLSTHTPVWVSVVHLFTPSLENDLHLYLMITIVPPSPAQPGEFALDYTKLQ